MKKILFTLCALLMAVSGAWADETTVTIVDGGNSNEPFEYYGTRDNSGTPNTFTTNGTSGLEGLTFSCNEIYKTTWFSTKCLGLKPSKAKTAEQVTITAPTGYLITGYSIECFTVSSVYAPYLISTAAEYSGSSVPASKTTYSVSGLSTSSTYFWIYCNASSVANYLGVSKFSVTLVPEESPTVDVTYHFMNSSGTEVATSAATTQFVGVAPSVPSASASTYCEYSFYSDEDCTSALTKLTDSSTDVYVTYTYSGLPFTPSTIGTPTYYAMMISTNANSWMEGNSSDATVDCAASNTITAGDASYFAWILIGDPVAGFKFYNVGKEKYLGGRTASGGYLTLVEEGSANSFIPIYNDASSVKFKEKTYGFYIDRSGGQPYAHSSGQQFTFQLLYKVKFTCDQAITLTVGSASTSLNSYVILSSTTATVASATDGYWINTYDGYDNLANALTNDGDGSIELGLSDNYASFVASNITPWYDTAGNYFSITSTAKDELDAEGYEAALTSCTYSTYSALLAIVENSANINYPATGFYRIKNKNTTKYIAYSSGLVSSSDGTAPASVIYFNGSKGTYKMSVQGLNVQKQTTNDQPFPATSDEGKDFVFTVSAPGVAVIKNTDSYVNSTYAGYLHDGGSNIVNWQSSSANSKWVVEAAESVTISLTEANDNTGTAHTYATLCVPFNVTALTGVDSKEVLAYAPTISGSYVNPGTGVGTIAAGTPVILIGAEGATSVTATIGSDYVTAPVSATLTGTFTTTSIDVTANTGTNYVLGFDEDNDDRIGFYHVNSTTFGLKANRAYLATGGNVKGYAINFTEDGVESVAGEQQSGTFYDLSGRKVAQPKTGLYIVNGKKVVIK